MADQLSEAVSYELDDDVAILRMDDGKANAIGFETIAGLNAGLDRTADEARAVVLAGREGKFSAGFDLAVMTGEDPEQAKELLRAGALFCHRLYLHPQPVIAACTGHALALGAIMLMSSDRRYGARGPFKIGTTEVAIGMQLPRFAVELARDRLSRRHFQIATQHALAYDPEGAVDVGFLDDLADPGDVEAEAVAYAKTLASTLHQRAFALTRGYVRAAVGEAVARGLEADMKDFSVG